MRVSVAVPLVLVAGLLFVQCGGEQPQDGVEPVNRPKKPVNAQKVAHVAVNQIVISFKGATPSQWVPVNARDQDDAKKLAKSLFARIESGVSFDSLKKEYTDSKSPKTGQPAKFIRAANKGVTHNPYAGEVPYKALHPGWRKAAFRLEVGGVALVEYDKAACPEGYFILQRLE